jgi:hypothetical protein
LPVLIQGRSKIDLRDYSLSGMLQHHSSECEPCGGRGFQRKADGKLGVCTNCCGIGKVYWGGWFARDLLICNYCMQEKVVDIFDNEKVCVGCYTSQHTKRCGCDLWAHVEEALGR